MALSFLLVLCPLPFCRGVFHDLDEVELSTKLTPESQENNVEYKIIHLKRVSGSDATVRLINLKYRNRTRRKEE